jgi:hypothetical protein
MSARPPAPPGKPRRLRVIALKTLLVFTLCAGGLWWLLPTQPRLTFSAEKGAFAGFSPDSQMFATATMSKESKGQWCGPVRLWDVQTGQERLQFAAEQKSISNCLFSPDGKVLATVGNDHLCTLWNTSTGQAEGAAPAQPPIPQFGSAARFAPDGSTFAKICAFMTWPAGKYGQLSPACDAMLSHPTQRPWPSPRTWKTRFGKGDFLGVWLHSATLSRCRRR